MRFSVAGRISGDDINRHRLTETTSDSTETADSSVSQAQRQALNSAVILFDYLDCSEIKCQGVNSGRRSATSRNRKAKVQIAMATGATQGKQTNESFRKSNRIGQLNHFIRRTGVCRLRFKMLQEHDGSLHRSGHARTTDGFTLRQSSQFWIPVVDVPFGPFESGLLSKVPSPAPAKTDACPAFRFIKSFICLFAF
jgi:hypothetical protein